MPLDASRLEDLGAGSSAIVGFFWAGHDGGGHWFNGFNDKGTIVASDRQTGRSEDWPPSDDGLGFTEADCEGVDAVFADAEGKHLTKDDLAKGDSR